MSRTPIPSASNYKLITQLGVYPLNNYTGWSGKKIFDATLIRGRKVLVMLSPL